MASALSYQTDRALDPARVHDEAVDEKRLESDNASVTGGLFVEGSEDVTHEELATLRHLPDSIPFAAFLVVVVEFAERWTYYGEFCITLRAVRGQFKLPRLTRSRFQQRSLCGEITSVLAFHLVPLLVPSPLTTGPKESPVLSAAVSKLPLPSETSTFSGSMSPHS